MSPHRLGYWRKHGLYTLYAASKPSVAVVAFEPSAARVASLVRNIELNGFGDRVQAFCIALAERNGIDLLAHGQHGGRTLDACVWQLHTIEGKLHPCFSQAVPGFSIDGFIRIFGAKSPDHIKLDVDSIEEQILRGGQETLRQRQGTPNSNLNLRLCRPHIHGPTPTKKAARRRLVKIMQYV